MKFHQESNIHLLIREDLLYLFYKDCVIGRHPIIQVILNIRWHIVHIVNLTKNFKRISLINFFG